MSRILLIGAFGYLNDKLDGQTIKTRDIYRLLCENHKGRVEQFDTLKVKQTKNPFLLFVLLWQLLFANTVLIAPASHSLATFFPIIYRLSFILRYKVVLIGVGGWHIEFFLGGHGYKAHPKELEFCKKIKAFLPEQRGVNEYLVNKLGFKNTEFFPNFRYIPQFKPIQRNCLPFKVVFMARIHIKKGYDTIFSFAEYVKQNNLNIIIDFYGQLEKNYKDDFFQKLNEYSELVKYYGELKPDNIHTTLSGYDVLVLPTQYYTEGFPGSILDAYIAGIPVIATEWKHSREFIQHRKTGIIIPFGECQNEFNNSVFELYTNSKMLTQMKQAAKEEAKKYSNKSAWNIISKYL